MNRITEEWLAELASLKVDEPQTLAILLCLSALLVAVVARHRAALVETMVLAALSMALVRYSEVAALLLAVISVVGAIRGPARLSRDRRAASMAREIDAINSRINAFLDAIDRRSREIDARDLETIAISKAMDELATLSGDQRRVSGKVAEGN